MLVRRGVRVREGREAVDSGPEAAEGRGSQGSQRRWPVRGCWGWRRETPRIGGVRAKRLTVGVGGRGREDRIAG